jgi:hypothetical protein
MRADIQAQTAEREREIESRRVDKSETSWEK